MLHRLEIFREREEIAAEVELEQRLFVPELYKTKLKMLAYPHRQSRVAEHQHRIEEIFARRSAELYEVHQRHGVLQV